MSRDYHPLPMTTDYSHYESGTHNISVVGSLKRHIAHFEKLGAPSYILQILRCGYVLPLKKFVPGTFKRNNRSSRDCPHFVQKAIDDLLDTGAVVEVSQPPRVVNPLTVAQWHEKLRLVLDLRHVNFRLKKHTCKIDNASVLARYLPGAKCMFGFDLKSGYHHVDIHPSQYELLVFSYQDFTGRVRYFHFVVLPFGLATAGFIFTQILRVLIHAWRRQGISILAYFDDGTSTAGRFLEASNNSALVKADLLASGFIPNYKICTWVPTPVLIWLGFSYNLLTMIISATPDKLQRVLVKLEAINTSLPVHVRNVAAVIGAIIAMHIAYGNIVYLKTKQLQILVAAQKLPDDKQDWERLRSA